MSNEILLKLCELIEKDKVTELEAERLLNAATRLNTGIPTGKSRIPDNQYTHTNH